MKGVSFVLHLDKRDSNTCTSFRGSFFDSKSPVRKKKEFFWFLICSNFMIYVYIHMELHTGIWVDVVLQPQISALTEFSGNNAVNSKKRVIFCITETALH